MKVFAGPRGSGRTTALAAWCQEKPLSRGMVVRDGDTADSVRCRWGDVMVITWESYCLLQPRHREWGIDDYDQMPLAASAPMPTACSIEADYYKNIPAPISFERMVAGLRQMELELR